MAAPAALIAASVAAPVIGGLMGQQAAGKDRKAAERARLQALARLDALDVPEYEQMGRVNFGTYDDLQNYSPEMLRAIDAEQSLMQGISTDPALRDAQMAALSRMSDIADDGMSAQDEFMLSRIESDQLRTARGQRDALDQQMRRRGISGSGLEMMAQLQGGQDAAMQASDRQMQAAAQAQARALAAIEAQNSMAGNLRGQDFSESERVARAQDAINQFNTSHRRDVQSQNLNASNQAQLQNRAFQQQLIDQRNDQNMFNNYQRQMDNNQIKNQAFQNQFQKASGEAGQLGNLAASKMNDAQRTQQMYGGIGQGVGQGILGYASYGNNTSQPSGGVAKPEKITMNYQPNNRTMNA